MIPTGTGCFSCHSVESTNPLLLPDHPHGTPLDIDDTLINNTCWSCHKDANPPIYVETHSNMQAADNFGSWTVECSVCHNQHYQEQNNLYSKTFGKFIRTNINLDKIKLYEADGVTPRTDPAKTGTRPIKLTAHTGANSFADGDPTTIDGICEVCHTRTAIWLNDGSVAGAALHTGLEGSNCTVKCHDHTKGFIHGSDERNCNGCHHISGDSGGTHIRYPGLGGPEATCEVCHDVTNITNFADGIPVSNMAGGSQKIGIGGSNHWIKFNGIIDEVVIYNRTLTPSEVLDRYNFHKP
jgi:hypothetical protein